MRVNTCAFVVRGLLEIRVAAGYRCVGDVDGMIAMIGKAVTERAEQDKFAIAADWRDVQVMSPDTAARAKEMLLKVNPYVSRSAILTLPENPTGNLQVVRLVREAENQDRRLFTAPPEMLAWLSQVLEPEAAARARSFLLERQVA